MPPVTILSPYSGRPVKIREHDLGRALRDEEGRVFYVVEDPDHGRYAARTRKGSQKDLERYREIEANVAKLHDEVGPDTQGILQAHDATGNKRQNMMGIALIVLIAIVMAAIGYAYIQYPEWFDQQDEAGDFPTEADPAPLDADPQSALPAQGNPPAASADEKAAQPADPAVELSAPGIAAAPLVIQRVASAVLPRDTPLVDEMGDDPEPIYVATSNEALHEQLSEASREPSAGQPTPIPEPKAVPIVLAANDTISPTNYDDFRHTASGLRFKITHLTDGTSARAGNYITIRYTAETLDGKPLINDASQSFLLAKGQAIRAFDEGLAGIREGEQLRLLVPRGHSNTGTLPGIDRIPDEPFLMDVQLVSVKPGISYIIEKQGDIDSPAALPGHTVDLHYLAKVEGRDEVIDATVHRGEPMRVTLGNNEIITGLELGITGMRVGESRQLTIPPYLAYGKYSVAGGLIPENAVLSFRLTLVRIVEDDQ